MGTYVGRRVFAAPATHLHVRHAVIVQSAVLAIGTPACVHDAAASIQRPGATPPHQSVTASTGTLHEPVMRGADLHRLVVYRLM
jgi:hypothetical protein